MNWSALHHAAFDGSMRLTKALLAGGREAIERRTGDGLGFTPLALAAQEGHYGIVKVLLQNGARVSARSDGGCTALIMAAIHGHAQVAQLLIESGADVDARDCNGVTSVYSAALKGHPKIVKLLIEAGAGVNISASDGCMPLHPSSKDGHLAVVRLLVEAGALLDVKNGDGGAPMHMAADQGHHGVVEALLQGGADPNCRMPRGQTPLFEASFAGHTDIVKLLLSARAHPALPVSCPDGGTGVALDVAAQSGHSETVRELLRLGLAVCGGGDRGESALRLAAQNRHLGVMRMLTDAGVVDTGIALSYSTDGGQVASVKFLLQQERAAADRGYANFRNKFGLAPLTLSVWSATPRITRMLLDAGADETLLCRDYSRTGEFFETPLALATLGLERKRHRGQPATEDELNRLRAIQRLLMRVEAVRAVSWLWVSDMSCVPPPSEETGGGETAVVASAALSVPVVWRRRQIRHAIVPALVR